MNTDNKVCRLGICELKNIMRFRQPWHTAADLHKAFINGVT